jgi:hypothetical protein
MRQRRRRAHAQYLAAGGRTAWFSKCLSRLLLGKSICIGFFFVDLNIRTSNALNLNIRFSRRLHSVSTYPKITSLVFTRRQTTSYVFSITQGSRLSQSIFDQRTRFRRPFVLLASLFEPWKLIRSRGLTAILILGLSLYSILLFLRW